MKFCLIRVFYFDFFSLSGRKISGIDVTERLQRIHSCHVEVCDIKGVVRESIDILEVVQKLVHFGYLDPSLFAVPRGLKMNEATAKKIQVG